jgi:porin
LPDCGLAPGGLSRGALFNFLDVSGIEALPASGLRKKWGDKIALRAGQLAVDTGFMTAKYTDVFTNASLGWPAGLSCSEVVGLAAAVSAAARRL